MNIGYFCTRIMTVIAAARLRSDQDMTKRFIQGRAGLGVRALRRPGVRPRP